jgi:protein involved in polysaccharide export with SLBB domain
MNTKPDRTKLQPSRAPAATKQMIRCKNWLECCLVVATAIGLSLRLSAQEPGAFLNVFSAEAISRTLELAARTNAARLNTNLSTSAKSTNVLSDLPETLDDKTKLGAGDRVSFRVAEDKDEPKLIYVSDSGELEVPYLGRVEVLGKTCRQLAKELKEALERKYYYQATVVVGIDVLNKTHGRVYLAGQIRSSGYQDIPTDETYTVSKAILRAGGFSDFADKKHVRVTRKKISPENGDESLTVDVNDVLEKGDTAKDLELEPDDRIFVPARRFNL